MVCVYGRVMLRIESGPSSARIDATVIATLVVVALATCILLLLLAEMEAPITVAVAEFELLFVYARYAVHIAVGARLHLQSIASPFRLSSARKMRVVHDATLAIPRPQLSTSTLSVGGIKVYGGGGSGGMRASGRD